MYGAMFGNHRVCGAFPTRSPVVTAKHRNAVTAQDHAYVIRAEDKVHQKNSYMCFDEAFFKNLELMQWNRDNGYVELIPIIVGISQ